MSWKDLEKEVQQNIDARRQQANAAKAQYVKENAGKMSAREIRNVIRINSGLSASTTVEQKAAQKNANNIKTGKPLELTDGKIYSFGNLSSADFQKSIDWANSEIEKLKQAGGKTNRLSELASRGLALTTLPVAGSDAYRQDVAIKNASDKIRELTAYKNTIQQYMNSAKSEEVLKQIEDNGDKELFSELYSIDTRKPTLIDTLGRAATAAAGGITMPTVDPDDARREQELVTALEKKYGDKFREYRQIYSENVKDKFKVSIAERIQNDIEEHPVVGTLGYTAANVLTSPVRGLGTLSESLSEASGNFTAAGGGLFQDMSEITTQKVNEEINERFQNEFAAGLVRTVYNAAVSGAESILTMGTFGRLGEAVLGLNAATSAYKDAKVRGLSEGEALANGIAAGLFETIFEHLSLDRIRFFQANPASTFKGFLKNVLSQSLVEGFEELGTDIANEAYDYFVNGGLSQYEQALQSGMTAEEYRNKFIWQLVETFATGALSGGGMTAAAHAPSYVSNTVNDARQSRATGEIIRQTDALAEVLQNAKDAGGKAGKLADNVQNKLESLSGGKSFNDSGKVSVFKNSKDVKISDKSVGKVYRQTLRQQASEAVDRVLSEGEYNNLSKKERNGIRSSVLTFINSPEVISPEQADVLKSEKGSEILEATRKIMAEKAQETADKVNERHKAEEDRRQAIAEKEISAGHAEHLIEHTYDGVNADGADVSVGAVKAIVDGDIEVIQDPVTGATAMLSDIKLHDSNAQELYSALQSKIKEDMPFDVNAMNTALAIYEPGENTDVEMFVSWAHDAYKAPALDMTFDEFRNMFNGEYEAFISTEQLKKMYVSGIGNIKTKPGVTVIGHKGMTQFQAEQVYVVDKLFESLGIEGVIVNGELSDDAGNEINAYFKSGTNKIMLSLNSDFGLITVAAGHELFHWVKEQSPENAAYLQNVVIGVLKSESKYNFDGIYKEMASKYKGYSENDILEEIAAQYLGVALNNKSTIERIVNEASNEQRSFIGKAIQHLKDFIKGVKRLLRIYGSRDKAVRAAVETPVEQLEFIAQRFEIALKEAAKNKKPATDEGGVKASIKNTRAMPYDEQVARAENGTLARSDALYICEAPENLLAIGLSNKPFAMHQGDYRKSRRVSANNENYSKHGIKVKTVKKLPKTIGDAVMIIDVGDKITVVTSELMTDTKGQPSYVIAGIHKDTKMNTDDVHSVKSLYPLDNFAVRIQKYAESGQLVITDKNKADELLARVGIQSSERSRVISLAKDTLSQSEADVKQNIVSYDDNGEIIPLSERFNPGKKDIRYSIKSDVDGNKFVDVDPDLFDARDGELHAKTIARIIKDRFDNLISVNGQQIQINKTTNDEWRRSKSANGFIKKDPQLYDDKLKTISHADEILQAAKNWIGEEPLHERKDDIIEFARGNVYYRVGGNGYVADVIVAIRKNGSAVLYDLSNIYTKKITEASVTMASESPQRSAETSVTDNISQNNSDVKEKFSRQVINSTWDDIRTKMSENGVHEDVVDEIDRYIRRLRDINVSRQEEVTGGLIPKYKAVLKIAREYTKGSDVDPHELANTISEMMWAAHDGNLDTKQFVSTVRLFAEDILRTGRKINDDMYRDYADFRNMTRSETVYVDDSVYNQYVEEYGSVKNLNSATQGKIKIKPRLPGDISGRALDDFYSELKDVFPALFREDADEYHQLYEILRAWEEIQPTTEYYSEMLGIKTEADLQHQALLMAEDMLSEVLRIKDAVKKIADKYENKAAFQKEYYKEYYRRIAEEGRRKRRESDEKDVLLKRITRNTKRLSDMLINQTDKRHIPENLKGPVSRFLQLISLYTDKRTSVNSTLDIVQLGRAYAEYGADNTANYDEDVQGWLEDLAIVFKDEVKISELNVADLKKVDSIVQHFNHLVNHGNEMFINGKRTEFLDVANKSFAELYKHAMLPEGALREFVNDKEYFMQTPIYFFKNIATRYENGRIVNDKLFDMFNDIRKGQDKWFRNIESVKKQIEEIKLKNNYSDSWKRDLREFELMSGERIKLTSEEVMYMYALNKREANNPKGLNHLLEGGIIADESGRTLRLVDKLRKEKEIKAARNELKEKKGNFTEDDIINSLKKNIVQGDLINMFATLTEDMQGYADDLVDMMSTTGAGMGNEVSMDLFGIKKFTEKYYIPISVAKEYLHFSVDNSTAEIRLKNRSFTKNTVRNANATVYVKSITDIAADHMQQMSLYNAMTVPIENIMRVYNYQKAMDEEISPEGIFIKQTGKSYKDVFKAVYGERGDKYFTDFMRDLNGGNQTQARDFVSGMIGMFKRSAVTGSLSVAIQQPSAVVRACALVDAKYFVPGRNTREDYEEMMKYNPVAGIKEIGRFDTGIGQTATEWILDENNGFIDKADNFLMYLPGRMDRMTWTYIWKAVKRETKALNKELSGDKLLEKAAERFRDVIDYTQVYDSTIARSGYMRDQGGTAKMVTAFMAEPTLSYNLLRDAAKNFGNDRRQGLKSIAAFTGATILNALLKSMVTALRKDDDESNYFELYTTDVIGNFFDDMNPLSLLPVVKDILNLAMGYDVERPDMTLFSNLINSGNVMWKRLQEGMTKEDIPVLLEELSVFIGAVSAFTKIPLNNLIKDLRGTFKTILGIKKSPDFSLNEVFNELKPTEDHVRCYDAIINKDDKFIERYLTPSDESINGFIKKGYSEEDAILKASENAENNFHSKVVLGLISEDIRIREAADARLEADAAEYESILEELCELGFDRNDVITAVNKYIASLDEPSYKQSEDSTVYQYTYDDLFNAIDKGNEASENAIYEYLRSNGAGQSSVQNKLKERYAEDVYNAVISKNEASYERYRKMFEEKYLYSIDKVLTYALEEYDNDIREAAESRYNLEFEEYQRIADSIIEKGFENTVVYGAIESAMNEFKPETPDKTYVAEPDYNYETEYADMHRAFEQNDLPKMKYVISELLDSGVKASSIKGSLSGKYRDKYKEAWLNKDELTCAKIREFLLQSGVGYEQSDFTKWERDAKEKQQEEANQ